MSMKNSNDTIGNRNRDLLAFSAMPQPTAPPRAPYLEGEDSLEVYLREIKTKLRGLSPHANYTDRAAAAGRRS